MVAAGSGLRLSPTTPLPGGSTKRDNMSYVATRTERDGDSDKPLTGSESRQIYRKRAMKDYPDIVLVSITELEGILGVTRMLMAKMEREAGFPKRIVLGSRTSMYRLSEVQEWLENRQAQDLKPENPNDKLAAKVARELSGEAASEGGEE